MLDDYKVTWYMQEIQMHCYGACNEYGHMTNVLIGQETQQTRLVWFHLSAFLSHAAMISKYLWPSPSGKSTPTGHIAKLRAEKLRDLLHISDHLDVLNRNARNNVEHFDERIDNWVKNDSQNILEIVFPNRDSYEQSYEEKWRIKRVLLLKELVFISENQDGHKFEQSLAPVHEQLIRIGNYADRWLTNCTPYQFIFPR